MKLPAALMLACASLLSASPQQSSWVQFHDPQTGLSFRYPPDLHVRQRDPRKFGLADVESIIELVGSTKLNRSTTVLRFLVHRRRRMPGARAKRREELRGVCSKTSLMVIDSHEAVVCVKRGRAAIHWSVEILEPRECTILTLLGGADADQAAPPPHDAEFPLLSIIRSVRFTSSGTSTNRLPGH